jgi:putative ABC transport system permease protein
MTTTGKSQLLKPRWKKIFSDLWGDMTRTLLVVSSVGVGVFAVGMILSAYMIYSQDINYTYAAINPVNVEIWTDPFYEDTIRVIEMEPGVEDVEGRRILNARSRRADENWQNLNLIGVEDIETSTINQLALRDGILKLGNNEVLVNEDFLTSTGYQVGDQIEVELPDGSLHDLTVVGLVTDQTSAAPKPDSAANAFVSMYTLRTMGLGNFFTNLMVTVEGSGGDIDLISEVADNLEEKLESNDLNVYHIDKNLSNEHPMADIVTAIMGILIALAGLVTLLSASLIINTLNALMAQQLRQIGVMKLIGGRSHQIMGMYMTLIVIYSTIALAITVPLGAIGGYRLSIFMAQFLGAQIRGFRIIPEAVLVQIVIAMLIPLGAGFFPVNKGARENVRRAISNYRPAAQSNEGGLVARLLSRIRWFTRPVMLSIRNTFRQRSRLALTIFTLTMAGAMFIGVFNVRTSMLTSMEELMMHFLGDVTITFSRPYNISKVERDLMSVPGVTRIEGWGGANAEILDVDDELVANLGIIAPPEDTDLLSPELIAGRWLIPGESRVLVISDSIYKFYPDLEIGDTLDVKIPSNREEAWEVVGVFSFVDVAGDPIAYSNFGYISDKLGMANQALSFRVITEKHENDYLDILIENVNQVLHDKNYAVKSLDAGYIMRESTTTPINTLIIFLLIMAILTAFVGSIGLTGTMSINVLERTREIGVMRTIGAVDTVVMQSVVIEGLMIGLITWVAALVFSFPVSAALLGIVSDAISGSAFELTITPLGSILWLAIVILLSVVASILPARKAAKLTINEVLAYE